MCRRRNTISSRAEFDGAHTSTRTRYLRAELTTSGFYIMIPVRRYARLNQSLLMPNSRCLIRVRCYLAWNSRKFFLSMWWFYSSSYLFKHTNSLPVVGKKPSSPSKGIISSLGLIPFSHGEAWIQWWYLQHDQTIILQIDQKSEIGNLYWISYTTLDMNFFHGTDSQHQGITYLWNFVELREFSFLLNNWSSKLV